MILMNICMKEQMKGKRKKNEEKDGESNTKKDKSDDEYE